MCTFSLIFSTRLCFFLCPDDDVDSDGDAVDAPAPESTLSLSFSFSTPAVLPNPPAVPTFRAVFAPVSPPSPPASTPAAAPSAEKLLRSSYASSPIFLPPASGIASGLMPLCSLPLAAGLSGALLWSGLSTGAMEALLGGSECEGAPVPALAFGMGCVACMGSLEGLLVAVVREGSVGARSVLWPLGTLVGRWLGGCEVAWERVGASSEVAVGCCSEVVWLVVESVLDDAALLLLPPMKGMAVLNHELEPMPPCWGGASAVEFDCWGSVVVVVVLVPVVVPALESSAGVLVDLPLVVVLVVEATFGVVE